MHTLIADPSWFEEVRNCHYLCAAYHVLNSDSAGADGKLNRVDAQSPVQAQTSTQQHTPAGNTQQQAFINPAAATLPPGYNYYTYPAGMLPTGYTQYAPNVFPVGNIVSTCHGRVLSFIYIPFS